ncbi:hypothetical protein OFW50_03730 [Lacticaseibacillus chiayiensis]|uniref:Uncharacterized protein n=1 Tax=Lacticaseibacillus chiayiensis TaxID=2100821 RepID=A0ABY6H760_9LACO|nr:hypothetical protein [Lacticaseibacillus chiayiensis]UYN57198.1 hypothetical protein OFW50_03730 [Lacticaseibacillus chiayiensis]
MKAEEHIDELCPICPYCGFNDEDVWETHNYNPNWIPGEMLTVECPNCERQYNVAWNISYDTEPLEETDETVKLEEEK